MVSLPSPSKRGVQAAVRVVPREGEVVVLLPEMRSSRPPRSCRPPAAPRSATSSYPELMSVVAMPSPSKEVSRLPSGLYRTTAKSSLLPLLEDPADDDLAVRLERHAACRNRHPGRCRW